MVLTDCAYFNSAFGLLIGQVTGFKIDISALKLKNIFFNLCEACHSATMAAVPPSAFSAGRIRETQQQDMKMSNITKGTSSTKYFDTKFAELSPLKYNSKLMNSIWGFYNRYSPHNVKKVNEAHAFSGELHQASGNSSNKNDVLTFPSGLDKMWAAINVSQSH